MDDAVQSQLALGIEFTTRGYLSTKWLVAMQYFQPDKPEFRLRHVHLGIWRILFQAVWETRNSILHGRGNFVERMEREGLIQELLEWRRLGASRLGVSQHYLIDYDVRTIMRWTTTAMHVTANLLVTAARNFRAQKDEGQTQITAHFEKITTSDDGSECPDMQY